MLVTTPNAANLIVEDKSAIGELVALHCKHTGYSVKTAQAGVDTRDIVDEAFVMMSG